MSKTHFSMGSRPFGCPRAHACPATHDIRQVTCLACRTYIRRRGLVTPDDLSDPPSLIAVPFGDVLLSQCPTCGVELVHGRGSGPRVAHCNCPWWRNGYTLTEVPWRSDPYIGLRNCPDGTRFLMTHHSGAYAARIYELSGNRTNDARTGALRIEDARCVHLSDYPNRRFIVLPWNARGIQYDIVGWTDCERFAPEKNLANRATESFDGEPRV